MTEDIIEAREQIIQYLEAELLGPKHGADEFITDKPFDTYITGVIYPQSTKTEVVTSGEEQDTAGSSGEMQNPGEDQSDDPIALANQLLPASMGISFFLINNPKIEVAVKAGFYEPARRATSGAEKKGYKRSEQSESLILEPPAGQSVKKTTVFGEKGEIHAVWRTAAGGWLVTVTLINLQKSSKGVIKAEECLYQSEIRVRAVDEGRISSYPKARLLTDESEQHVLDLMYRHQASYGTGHGCSVTWSAPEKGSVEEVRSVFLPTQKVPQIDFSLKENFDELLSLYFLSGSNQQKGKLISELERFLDGYEAWIFDQAVNSSDIPNDLFEERDQLIGRMEETLERMRKGVRLLQKDSNVLNAFCDANKAMLLQRIHSEDALAGKEHKAHNRRIPVINLEDRKDFKWRPFQLAFQLLSIPSLAYPEDPDREIVDLIWFPTGGGKTEAYLAVAAFLIFFRRLKYGITGGGTSIIMRYTLRLLTTQQFQRASTMICACEIIRRENPVMYLDEPISIGLWIGNESTPGTYQNAYNKFIEFISQNDDSSPFQIDRCPWCGTELIPASPENNPEWIGIDCSPRHFRFFCPAETCVFHDELPLRVVDDHIYEYPPSLLLATVDKFARMPWVSEVKDLFGGTTGRKPDLIIQDELHLISGPLGTMVGLYETAMDAITRQDNYLPKVIASTATIRNADSQCKSLYARQVQLFPPSGLEASDSYFSRYDKDGEGRLYLGVMGQGHTATTSFLRIAAALLQAPVDLELTGDSRDAYWTLVGYHNSLRELGKTLTMAADDIPARIKVISKDQSKMRQLNGEKVVELTSNRKGTGLTRILNKLSKSCDDEDSISFLVSTNMISVGVDVQRLGVMLVNGQPKTTSEYIQATSRVGRGFPGLVVTALGPTKPRDRSHYEHFIEYHSALYRFVEPSSVTPFAQPARDRGLHGVLVSAIRHKTGYNSNESAQIVNFDDDRIQSIIRFIVDRVGATDPAEAQATEDQLNALVEEWKLSQDENMNLVYYSSQRQIRSLLKQYGDVDKDGWETMNSMRNVDKSCIVKPIGRVRHGR